jgi:hypothetical protein
MAKDFDPTRPMFFITLVHDGWRTPLRDAVINLVEIRQRARDCLRNIGFEGIAIIEFDVLVRPACDAKGHQILPHIHAFGYLETNEKVRRRQLHKLRRSKRLTSFNGASTVVCKTLPTADDVMHAVGYALKLPLCVKRMVPKKGYPGHTKMRTHNRRQQHALLSVIEILSYLRQKDLVFSTGGWSRWLTDACKTIDKSRTRRLPWFSRSRLSRLWQAVHRSNRFTCRETISVRNRK